MARKPYAEAAVGGGKNAFFAALAALTYREMLDVSELLAMQIEDGAPAAAVLADALANAADSHFAPDED